MIRAVCFDLFHTLIDVGRSPGTPGRYTADILGLDREDWNNACFSEAHDICRPTDYREVVRQLAHSLDPSIPLSLVHEAAEERKAYGNGAGRRTALTQCHRSPPSQRPVAAGPG